MVDNPQNLNSFTGSWIGDLRGSSHGNLFAITTLDNEKLNFRITVGAQENATTFEGHVVFDGSGNKVLFLNTDSPQAKELPKPHARVDIDILAANEIGGRWASVRGHAGLFWLRRASTGAPAEKEIKPAKPIELLAKEVSLPKLTIYRDELEILIEKLRALMGDGNDVIVTMRVGSNDVTQYGATFLSRTDLPPKLTQLRLNVNDGRQPFQNSINVVLSNTLPSQFIVQSDNQIWMNGVSAELIEFFGRYTNQLVTYFQRYGLNLNFVFFLAVIATLPDLSLANRYIFLVVMILLAAAFMKIHAYFNATKIYTSAKIGRDWLSTERVRVGSGIVTTVMVGALGAIATAVYQLLLQGKLADLLKWFGEIVGR
ncbi:MAG: hypothetical protein ACRECO_10790 [Xanthobacteraceae bacterium]